MLVSQPPIAEGNDSRSAVSWNTYEMKCLYFHENIYGELQTERLESLVETAVGCHPWYLDDSKIIFLG